MGACAIEGCEKPKLARGWCSTHYARWHKHGDPHTVLPLGRQRPPRRCSVEDCERPVSGRGFCQMHYYRWWKHGDVSVVLPRGGGRPRLDGRPRHQGSTARDRHLRRNYGISEADYTTILDQQDGVCAICRGSCKTGFSLAVDHDHATGQIRGLLCRNCNTALGVFNDESRLRRAIQYLGHNQPPKEQSC